jgi:uncharacterized protein YeaO (DUF488 family)
LSVRIVRLGAPRHRSEGLRIGTVRRPPRGVPKKRFAADDWYDIWFPTLAPSLATLKLGQSARSDAGWKSFLKRYRSEMNSPDAQHALELLARLSRQTNLSVGCYCADESRCHRSVLRALLIEKGADVAR